MLAATFRITKVLIINQDINMYKVCEKHGTFEFELKLVWCCDDKYAYSR